MRDGRRVIDANSNRASEAARTLEDLSRFVLDNGPLALRWKRVRHGLEEALASVGLARSVRAASRDTRGDEGVANSAADRHARADLVGVASAAGGRLTEALRVLEEMLKLQSPEASAAVERLRYDTYDAEKLLLRRLTITPRRWPVCVLVTESLCSTLSWLDVARAAIEGGAACLQLREKDLPDRELLARARTLVELARPRGVDVVINDRPDIAVLAGADGVHVGQGDLSPEHARRIVGDGMSVGVSCSTLGHALEAVETDADVIGLGAMYPSRTKPKPEIAGVDLLRQVLEHPAASKLHHLAIGGITAERAAELARLGCRGVAVSGAVCGAADPRAATMSIVETMAGAQASQGVGP